MTGDVRVETNPVGMVVRPRQDTGAVVLYFPHDQQVAAGRAEQFAAATGATVVVPHQSPAFPAALQDAHAGYRFCQGMGPVVVAGERLGAGLGAALLVHLRDSGEALPRGAVFLSGLLDVTMQSRSLWLNTGVDFSLDVTTLRRRVAEYAGDIPLTDAVLNPVYANLHGLPPVALLVAATDPLLDDSLAFASRAARDRVTVDLRVTPDLASARAEARAFAAAFVDRHGRALRDSASPLVS
jgi:epsilon-lactone hydrolase